tara:strand:- start:191 stop:400 length:210 start_codon:yes stop_codon:yes gene_type:complete
MYWCIYLARIETMTHRTFSITFSLKIDEDNNILGSHDDSHAEDVYDLIINTFYDIDDVTINNLIVKEKL